MFQEQLEVHQLRQSEDMSPPPEMQLTFAGASSFSDPNGSTPPWNRYALSGSTFVTTTHTLLAVTALC